MDLKELAKLENLTAGSSKGKSPSITVSLDSLLESLTRVQDRLRVGTVTEDTFTALSKTVDARKKEIDDRQKEIYSSIARLGKALDKTFSGSLPSQSNIFKEKTSLDALEKAVAMHFLRTGQFVTADTFIKETGLDISPGLSGQFHELHRILVSLKKNDITLGLHWAERNSTHLQGSPLVFHLHSFHFLCILQQSPLDPTTQQRAVAYGKSAFAPFWTTHASECRRLFGCIAYWKDLKNSPYADLTAPSVHKDLQSLFTVEFCARLQMGGAPPLRVVVDIGGGGALARIEKGRKVMRERKSEWSQEGELPMEIPLPPENRYHSVFTCPVSKEQATEDNPPMMMVCGHVITDESLQRLSRNGRVKCPYCPVESQKEDALRVYF